MPLPSDPDYVCTASEHVRKHSTLLKRLLASGTDPYAPHSRSPSIIMQIEMSVVVPPGE
jgi:hypothetical protein